MLRLTGFARPWAVIPPYHGYLKGERHAHQGQLEMYPDMSGHVHGQLPVWL
jgi:hypothetical protein